MLDIGFGELIVIAVVALVVIGPERLPRVARTAGHLLGRFQRYVSDVKADINREIELSELKNIKSSVEDAARSIDNVLKVATPLAATTVAVPLRTAPAAPDPAAMPTVIGFVTDVTTFPAASENATLMENGAPATASLG